MEQKREEKRRGEERRESGCDATGREERGKVRTQRAKRVLCVRVCVCVCVCEKKLLGPSDGAGRFDRTGWKRGRARGREKEREHRTRSTTVVNRLAGSHEPSGVLSTTVQLVLGTSNRLLKQIFTIDTREKEFSLSWSALVSCSLLRPVAVSPVFFLFYLLPFLGADTGKREREESDGQRNRKYTLETLALGHEKGNLVDAATLSTEETPTRGLFNISLSPLQVSSEKRWVGRAKGKRKRERLKRTWKVRVIHTRVKQLIFQLILNDNVLPHLVKHVN